MNAEEDRLVTVLPIHLSNALAPNVHIHQFPLLTRPLQAPPSARAAGKRIAARIKPKVKRLEVHVPVDTRQQVWNNERARELGVARVEDDKEKNQESQKTKLKEGEEPRLSEVRIQSERIPQKGAYMLGVVRDAGRLHLHPISESYQLRPTLTYMDVLSRRNKRSRAGDDSDSDDGPPPDPDEEAPPPVVKKEKKPTPGEAREVQVAARRSDKEGGQAIQGGLSAVRREMLLMIRAEEEETWEDLEYCEGETEESGHAFEGVFSRSQEPLECKTAVADFLNNIRGLQ
ncbi:hypothetical protein GLOTRDRAFT_29922 [Gloeophyllum trabeum ATCC 11539]|uniref:DNA-directed RNA polymerase III subunit Rpc5 n=1 Tax=Gloeophyllum trabeum (strain ATCC 11539 / FP-39264 / Madison 617) TaxID=670483 RepID=S7QN31_GLOTA|nr:uncharacterized protein GLOTRDRAFT_29922 [Gloeophyllum trabeum ATCC 11539]EPQ60827.1 hypothetical protein GLOTRDRAFT_29922 [Gloeophyllum trabeum ATCC 11539]